MPFVLTGAVCKYEWCGLHVSCDEARAMSAVMGCMLHASVMNVNSVSAMIGVGRMHTVIEFS